MRAVCRGSGVQALSLSDIQLSAEVVTFGSAHARLLTGRGGSVAARS